MTLYLVHGNTWFEGYGYEEYVFGVYTTLTQAETAKIAAEKRLQKRLREDIENDPDICFDNPEDVKLQILELNADELVEEYLGGYLE
nr:MAG TPA: protein of unknown function DUF957 [Bacteriophage sp.]